MCERVDVSKDPRMTRAIEVLNEQGYASVKMIGRRVFEQNFDKRRRMDRQFYNDLVAFCNDQGVPIGKLTSHECSQAFLEGDVFYSKKWAVCHLSERVTTVGWAIGLDLFRKINRNGWYRTLPQEINPFGAPDDEALDKHGFGNIYHYYSWVEFYTCYRALEERLKN